MNSPLDAYRQKRNFQRTPEPRGDLRLTCQPSPASPLRFVLQRHEASRLHYDLRLELEGRLISWAIPKGVSFTAHEKRLAVRTEDHPLEYLEFEGVIPAGQYGAGTMSIADHGTYQPLVPLDVSLPSGKLELVLNGFGLRGEWHLFQLPKQPQHWMIFKARDRYAFPANQFPIAIDPRHFVARGYPRSRAGSDRRMQPRAGDASVLDQDGWA